MSQIIMPYLSEAITALVAAFGGWFFSRRKTRAEAKSSELAVVQDAIRIWRETAQDLKNEILDLRKENELLRCEVNKLRRSSGKILKALDKLNAGNYEDVIRELREKIVDHE